MRYRWPCQWPCVALAWVLFPWVFCAGAVPEVKVAVSASFKPAAYLLELLLVLPLPLPRTSAKNIRETAADENQTAYFPLLDRVAEGRFSHARTDEELYTVFLQTLQDDGHVSDADALASFQFALSLRSAAPRIEAHYQFYNTSIRPPAVGAEGECRTWVHFNGRRYCSPLLHESEGIKLGHKYSLCLFVPEIVVTDAMSGMYANCSLIACSALVPTCHLRSSMRMYWILLLVTSTGY